MHFLIFYIHKQQQKGTKMNNTETLKYNLTTKEELVQYIQVLDLQKECAGWNVEMNQGVYTLNVQVNMGA